ncbi:MAG: hypothetical protein EBT13_17690 [Rhodobacteraceae bacterium]|nr:hypothetical protein [Paracoccaceae bacterium]
MHRDAAHQVAVFNSDFFKSYKKKVIQSNSGAFVTDMPNTRGEVHAVQCLEYLCAYEPSYHAPPSTPAADPWWVKWLAERKKRRGEDGKGYVCLGPTRS